MTEQEAVERLARALSVITHRAISSNEVARLPAQHIDSVLAAFTERYARGEQAYRLLERLKGLTESPYPEPPAFDSGNLTACIVEAVCKRYGLTHDDLLSTSRKSALIEPRQIAMYLVRAHAGVTAREAAEALGRKDHSTVLYAVRIISKRMAGDSGFAERVHAILLLARQLRAEAHEVQG